MGALNLANLKKTIYYLQRNGLKNTWHAARERLSRSKEASYVYMPPTGEELAKQRKEAVAGMESGAYQGIRFSIVVPLYRTKSTFLQELMDSIRAQSYPFAEVIFADATEGESLWEVLKEFPDVKREEDAQEAKMPDTMVSDQTQSPVFRYIRLDANGGISENTNAALPYVTGEYVGLLDHDDILTPDALFEMAEAIRLGREKGQELSVIYSDEDKCDGSVSEFYEPHQKEDFNYDLILSNNYICHFLVMKRELIQELGFRKEYDGAQDYDLVLRAVKRLGIPEHPEREACIGHVGRVLYHWRCHAASTAENPRSKEYAYEAGRRALQDYMDTCGIIGTAEHMKHVGFYRMNYDEDIFKVRTDLGAVGGPVTEKGKIAGGRMDAEGTVFYGNLNLHHSGYMNRAVLTQSAEAVDIRNLSLREELWELFEEVTGIPYRTADGTSICDVTRLSENADCVAMSLKLCKAIRERGYRILWCRRDNE